MNTLALTSPRASHPRSLAPRALAVVLATLLLSGCYHFVGVRPDALPQTRLADARVRITVGRQVVELEHASLTYPMLRGRVRTIWQESGHAPAVGTEGTFDLRQAQHVEVRRFDTVATVVLVTLVVAGVVVTVVAGVVLVGSLFAGFAGASM